MEIGGDVPEMSSSYRLWVLLQSAKLDKYQNSNEKAATETEEAQKIRTPYDSSFFRRFNENIASTNASAQGNAIKLRERGIESGIPGGRNHWATRCGKDFSAHGPPDDIYRHWTDPRSMPTQ